MPSIKILIRAQYRVITATAKYARLCDSSRDVSDIILYYKRISNLLVVHITLLMCIDIAVFTRTYEQRDSVLIRVYVMYNIEMTYLHSDHLTEFSRDPSVRSPIVGNVNRAVQVSGGARRKKKGNQKSARNRSPGGGGARQLYQDTAGVCKFFAHSRARRRCSASSALDCSRRRGIMNPKFFAHLSISQRHPVRIQSTRERQYTLLRVLYERVIL